jgi:hypothetical protein
MQRDTNFLLMGVGLHVFGQVIAATIANFEVSFAGSTIGEV